MARKHVFMLAIVSGLSTPALCVAEPSAQAIEQAQIGSASYYSRRFEGRRTASGEALRNDSLTAAHRSLPFGTLVLVTCLEKGRSVVVRITDRLPSRRAIIDLTHRAAAQLNMLSAGRARVSVQVLEAGKGGAQVLREAAPQPAATLTTASASIPSPEDTR